MAVLIYAGRPGHDARDDLVFVGLGQGGGFGDPHRVVFTVAINDGGFSGLNVIRNSGEVSHALIHADYAQNRAFNAADRHITLVSHIPGISIGVAEGKRGDTGILGGGPEEVVPHPFAFAYLVDLRDSGFKRQALSFFFLS